MGQAGTQKARGSTGQSHSSPEAAPWGRSLLPGLTRVEKQTVSQAPEAPQDASALPGAHRVAPRAILSPQAHCRILNRQKAQ